MYCVSCIVYCVLCNTCNTVIRNTVIRNTACAHVRSNITVRVYVCMCVCAVILPRLHTRVL